MEHPSIQKSQILLLPHQIHHCSYQLIGHSQGYLKLSQASGRRLA